jgi:hypothetical protein
MRLSILIITFCFTNYCFAQSDSSARNRKFIFEIIRFDSTNYLVFNSINKIYFLDSNIALLPFLRKKVYKKIGKGIPDYYILNKNKTQYLRIVTNGNALTAIQMSFGMIRNRKYLSQKNVIHSNISAFFITSKIEIGSSFGDIKSVIGNASFIYRNSSNNSSVLETKSLTEIPDSVCLKYCNYRARFHFKNDKLEFCEMTSIHEFINLDKMHLIF